MKKIFIICAIVFGIGSIAACTGVQKQQTQSIECSANPIDVFGNDYSAADFKLWLKPTKEITYDMLADVAPIFDGTDIKDVYADKNYQSDPMVVFYFDEKGAKEWENITLGNIGRYVVFTLGDSVLSSSFINCQITGGVCAIFTNSEEEACALVEILKKK
jgi:preprotein translocase subunit SecD